MNTLLILTLSLVTRLALASTSSLTSGDRQRFFKLFQSAVQEEANVDFGVLGLKLLGENVANAGELCKRLQSQADVSLVNVEKLSTLTFFRNVISFLFQFGGCHILTCHFC